MEERDGHMAAATITDVQEVLVFPSWKVTGVTQWNLKNTAMPCTNALG